MSTLRSKSEKGYVPPQRTLPTESPSGSTFVDRLRARVNKWTPEQAEADAQRRAEARREAAEADIEYALQQEQRLEEEQQMRLRTFATEALVAAVKRAEEDLGQNTDEKFKWSGKGRRGAIQEATGKLIAELEEKARAAADTGAPATLTEEARAVVARLEAAMASREDTASG
jgi:predicted enzyme related to lactoylglutathione lyase